VQGEMGYDDEPAEGRWPPLEQGQADVGGQKLSSGGDTKGV